jgi:hypothetical protein
MAASPVPDIIELIQGHLRPYDPESGQELWELVQELPDLLDALSTTFMSLAVHIAEKPGGHQSLCERLDTIETAVEQAKTVAEEARDDFKRDNAFWLDNESE